MFAETARIGGLDVQLVYFRGFNECRASKWVSNPTALARLMMVDRRGGNTQIGRALAHIKKEMSKTKVNAVIYVGDAMEENIDVLCQQPAKSACRAHRSSPFRRVPMATPNAVSGKWPSSAAVPISSSMNHWLTCCGKLLYVVVDAAGGQAALENHAKTKGGNADGQFYHCSSHSFWWPVADPEICENLTRPGSRPHQETCGRSAYCIVRTAGAARNDDLCRTAVCPWAWHAWPVGGISQWFSLGQEIDL